MNRDISIFKKYTVLYVEDEIELREELESFMKRRMKKVITAENGIDGLEKFKLEKPDFILTDIKMPKMNGLEFAKEIRKLNLLIPIIVISALSDLDMILTTVEVGIDKYIVKPIQMDELNEAFYSAIKKTERINQDLYYNKATIFIEDKEEYEKNIQANIAKLLKDAIGKGPKRIQASINGQNLMINIIGSRTNYEKTLLSKSENIKILNFMRENFYNELLKELKDVIESSIKQNIGLISIETNSKLDIDILNFKIN